MATCQMGVHLIGPETCWRIERPDDRTWLLSLCLRSGNDVSRPFRLRPWRNFWLAERPLPTTVRGRREAEHAGRLAATRTTTRARSNQGASLSVARELVLLPSRAGEGTTKCVGICSWTKARFSDNSGQIKRCCWAQCNSKRAHPALVCSSCPPSRQGPRISRLRRLWAERRLLGSEQKDQGDHRPPLAPRNQVNTHLQNPSSLSAWTEIPFSLFL